MNSRTNQFYYLAQQLFDARKDQDWVGVRKAQDALLAIHDGRKPVIESSTDRAIRLGRTADRAVPSDSLSDAVDFDVIDRLLDEHGCGCQPSARDSIDCMDQRDKLRAFREALATPPMAETEPVVFGEPDSLDPANPPQLSARDCVRWLDAKFARHHEVEDHAAAEWLRYFIARQAPAPMMEARRGMDAVAQAWRNRFISERTSHYQREGKCYEEAVAYAESDANEYEAALTAALSGKAGKWAHVAHAEPEESIDD